MNPAKVDSIKKAVWEIGVRAMTVSDVRGFGYEKTAVLAKRSEYAVELVPKAQVEIVVPDAEADAVAETVQRAAWTGRIGDGQIFVLPVLDAVRIRTGERGETAV